MPPVDPAATVLARFGGAGPLAQLLRLDRSARSAPPIWSARPWPPAIRPAPGPTTD